MLQAIIAAPLTHPGNGDGQIFDYISSLYFPRTNTRYLPGIRSLRANNKVAPILVNRTYNIYTHIYTYINTYIYT